jgi:hypothetical protein
MLGAAPELGVNELVYIPELQLDCSLDIVKTHNGSMVTDDLDAALKFAPVVVCQFKHKQVFEQIAVTLRDMAHRDALVKN